MASNLENLACSDIDSYLTYDKSITSLCLCIYLCSTAAIAANAQHDAQSFCCLIVPKLSIFNSLQSSLKKGITYRVSSNERR